MPVSEHPLQALANYIPSESFNEIINYINRYKIYLTVTRKRKSVLGDFRHASSGKNHRVSINGNLNKYEFLITLLHEIAHLLTFENFGNKVDAHGKEWKNCYSSLIIQFVNLKIFPTEIEKVLVKTINNPAATANGETELLRVLRNFNDVIKPGLTIVEEVPFGEIFETQKGKTFKKGLKRRNRYECVEIETGKKYAFSAIAEVKITIA